MHSQFNEDEIILDFFGPQSSGVYVDIGCGDPIKGNNTFCLYQCGWTGLCVDPQQCYKQRYKEYRNKDTFIECAISNITGKSTLYDVGCFATLEKNLKRNYHIEQGIDTYKLKNILNEHIFIRDNCKLCSIDVEHHEQQVLESIDFNVFRPEMFIIEAFDYDRWQHLLLNIGYVYYKSSLPVPVNRFYIKK